MASPGPLINNRPSKKTGLTPYYIAKREPIAKSTAERWLQAAGIYKPKQLLLTKPQLISLIESGYTARQLSIKFNTRIDVIHYMLKKYKLKIKPKISTGDLIYMYKMLIKPNEISRCYSVSNDYVIKKLKAAGIYRRVRSK